jgi:sialic acid synthase SpsE
MCFVQIDSVAEEVERQKSRTDMVIYKCLESYATFIEDYIMVRVIHMACFL